MFVKLEPNLKNSKDQVLNSVNEDKIISSFIFSCRLTKWQLQRWISAYALCLSGKFFMVSDIIFIFKNG